MIDHEKEESVYKCTQNSYGTHFIRDGSGNEVKIDTNELTMADIRELMKGLGKLMESVSVNTWDKRLTYYSRLDKSK